jgi:NAD(P)-dependent dehydrogenase (short-subunit alcohol dehydrogenase family)
VASARPRAAALAAEGARVVIVTNLLVGRITGRVVTVTSRNYRNAHIGFEDLQWEWRPYRPFGAYGQAKLANMLFSRGAAAPPDRGRLIGPGHRGGTRLGRHRIHDEHRPAHRRPHARAGYAALAQSAEGGARPTVLAC